MSDMVKRTRPTHLAQSADDDLSYEATDNNYQLPAFHSVMDRIDQLKHQTIAGSVFFFFVVLAITAAVGYLWFTGNVGGSQRGFESMPLLKLMAPKAHFNVTFPWNGHATIVTVSMIMAILASLLEFLLWPFAMLSWAKALLLGASAFDVIMTSWYYIWLIPKSDNFWVSFLVSGFIIFFVSIIALLCEFIMVMGIMILWKLKDSVIIAAKSFFFGFWRKVAHFIRGCVRATGAIISLWKTIPDDFKEGKTTFQASVPQEASRTVSGRFN